MPRLWYWLVGSPDHTERDIRAATSHGALIALLARIWFFPLMLFFSLGALVTLGSQPMAHNMTLLQEGYAPDWIEVIGLAVTVVFVIGMDLAMISAATRIRDARRHGARITAFWFDALIVLLVGGIETWTFFQMVAESQGVPIVVHPTALYETIFIGYRAVLVPVVAIYLAIARTRTATRQDIEQLLRIKVGHGLLAYLERSVQMGDATPVRKRSRRRWRWPVGPLVVRSSFAMAASFSHIPIIFPIRQLENEPETGSSRKER